MTTAEHVRMWLASYLEAWRTYDPDLIGDLFAVEATYAYHPWDEPIRGREAIVADWLREPDPPGSWDAEYRPLLVAGRDVAVEGRTRYADGKVYENLWILEFDDDGRCSSFVEWYMVSPESGGSASDS